jgi:hypothetical protein
MAGKKTKKDKNIFTETLLTGSNSGVQQFFRAVLRAAAVTFCYSARHFKPIIGENH